MGQGRKAGQPGQMPGGTPGGQGPMMAQGPQGQNPNVRFGLPQMFSPQGMMSNFTDRMVRSPTDEMYKRQG